MTILDKIDELTLYIDKLMDLEEKETFGKSDLQEWIYILKKGNLKCPCQHLNIGLDICPFYSWVDCSDCNVCEDCEYEDDCEYDHNPQECKKYCDDCYGYSDCGDCPRSEVWDEIQSVGSYVGMSTRLVNWFIGQIIAERLEKLL